MEYNIAAVRQLADTALADEDLSTLCFEHFREVYDQFATGQTRGFRIRLLVEHAFRQRQLPMLLEHLRERNPRAYAEFAPRLTAPPEAAATPPSLAAVKVSISRLPVTGPELFGRENEL